MILNIYFGNKDTKIYDLERVIVTTIFELDWGPRCDLRILSTAEVSYSYAFEPANWERFKRLLLAEAYKSFNEKGLYELNLYTYWNTEDHVFWLDDIKEVSG